MTPGGFGTVDRRIIPFLHCGGIAAVINWASRFLWNLMMPFGAAVVVAYASGMAVAFLLYRHYVFPASTQPVPAQAMNFVLVNIVGMGATLATAQLLLHIVFPTIGMRVAVPAISHGIAVFVPAITGWLGHKYLTFR